MVRIGVKPHQLGASLDELRRAWREAEDAGFESVWVFDHISRAGGQPCLEALSLLGALAQETSRVRIGVLVLNAGLRHPAYVAAAAATLDRLSGGRLEIGVGAGSAFGMADLAAFGLPQPRLGERLAILEEYCQVLRALWTGERVDFEGRYYTLADAAIGAEPAQQELPLIVGGGSRRALQAAGRYGDEWNLSLPKADVEAFSSRAAALSEFAAETGRTVKRSVQLYVKGVPQDELDAAVGWFVSAGAERVVLVIDPPFAAGSITALGRRVFA